MTFVSYAQNFEDVLLWRALGGAGPGFYIDVGAAHPDVDSVTRAFYDRGWRGLDVEPVPDYARRLRAARTRDVVIEAAAGEATGDTTLFVVAGTGLSTTEASVAARLDGVAPTAERRTVPVVTLASLCAEHAPPDIHFLKVDAEGAERSVLAGADFARFRPWIVLVEATAPMTTELVHDAWEPILLAAGYRFIWFDGLNRFYLAEERYEALAPAFATPPNVFDDFLRAADTEWARRIHQAEDAVAALRERTADAERREAAEAAGRTAAVERLLAAERRLGDAGVRLVTAEARAATLSELASARGDAVERAIAERDDLGRRIDRERVELLDRIAEAERKAAGAQAWADAMRASTSWRMTAPLRQAVGSVQRRRPARAATPAPPMPPAHAADPASGPRHTAVLRAPPAMSPSTRPPTRIVHQFHSGSAVGDAITRAMLLTRDRLRGLGYRSEIFAEHVDPQLTDTLRPMDELPEHPDYVLILRHSMGYDAFPRLAALRARKILLYHNITPPDLLSDSPHYQPYARLGRQQLAVLPPLVEAALADSEYNAIELRRMGFASAEACTLLFDIERMTDAAVAPASPADPAVPFTVLFVGRLIQSKAQADLVDAYARFRQHYRAPARLVLVGRTDVAAYRATVEAAIAIHRLEQEVVLAGPVADAVLADWFRSADLYVSLSHHEGFGVPLVEAIAQGVPVLAAPTGAVPYTLGDAEGLLGERGAESVGLRMAALASDPAARRRLLDRQRQGLARFRLDRQVPILLEALAKAGAPVPARPGRAGALAANLRFTVTGHVNGTYSLAGINRGLALALESARPGSVRIVPVEGEVTPELAGLPEQERVPVTRLVARPRHETGPDVVISQHYPVWVPHDRGDVTLAMLFWEESLLPPATIATLARHFDAVLAPTRFVARALIDSGLPLPVHVVGHAPDLALFREGADDRARVAAGVPRPFTLLHVSSCFPRKGVDVLLAAYARAFRPDAPVRLVVKTFPNPHNDVAKRIDRLRAHRGALPPITLIDRDLDRAELLALYADADVLVLPTRGEGYNLPAAEAMAAGLPLIVTGRGGHEDFVTMENARLLRAAPAPSGSHLATPHSLWLEPDEDDLVDALREAATMRDDADMAARWAARGRRARADIAAATDRDTLLRRIAGAAVAALLRPPPAPTRIAWISSWDVHCGIAEYSRHLLDHAPDDGARVTLLADDRIATEPAADGRPGAVRAVWRLGGATGMAETATAVAAIDPDAVVIQHQPGLFPWASLAALLDSRPLRDRTVAVTLHNTRHLREVDGPERAAAVAALSGVDRILVHTLADVAVLGSLGLEANVTVFPHGATAALTPPPVRPLTASDAPLIGCYGFFLPGKGIGALIEALAALRRRWPRARLRLVNAAYSGTESRQEIDACRARAAALGLDDAIAWVTEFLPHDRSLGLLRDCDLIVLPYEESKESSSAALRSALAAGVPVAVTPLPLFVEAEAATIRLSGTGPAALAADLDRILGDATLRTTTRDAAGRWLEDRAWPLVAARMFGMLRGLVATREAGERIGPA